MQIEQKVKIKYVPKYLTEDLEEYFTKLFLKELVREHNIRIRAYLN